MRRDPTGFGPKTELDQDWYQPKCENLGPYRTRTSNFFKISDQFGLVGPRTGSSWIPGNA